MKELFEQEYIKIEKSLFMVALGYLHNTEDAKDAVQESVFLAYKSFNKLREIKYFKTWITRIVINQCKNNLKRYRYTEELNDNINVFYNMPEGDIDIMDAICRLDQKQSVYITLRFYNDMTYEETAKLLKQPVSTVKYRTKKAIIKLKNILEGDV
jgi:RNA polymerase sigma factor, sigma-70 family